MNRHALLNGLTCNFGATPALLAPMLWSSAFTRAAGSAAEPPSHDKTGCPSADNAEGTWRAVNRQPLAVGSHDLFSAALAWCEAGTQLGRLKKLLNLAAQMQDPDPQSRTHGNFRWSWQAQGVWGAKVVLFFLRFDMEMLAAGSPT